MTLVEQEAGARGLEGGLINQNHDALLVDALESELDEWLDVLRTCMVDRIHELVDLSVPLVIDISVGKDWGAMRALGEAAK
jgi:DNA polymerase-1